MPVCDRRVGTKIHYVARGSLDGVYPPVCRLAFIAAVRDVLDDDPYGKSYNEYDIVVLNPEGMFFNRNVKKDDSCKPGTWHHAPL